MHPPMKAKGKNMIQQINEHKENMRKKEAARMVQVSPKFKSDIKKVK